jgi:hypothetical protein
MERFFASCGIYDDAENSVRKKGVDCSNTKHLATPERSVPVFADQKAANATAVGTLA